MRKMDSFFIKICLLFSLPFILILFGLVSYVFSVVKRIMNAEITPKIICILAILLLTFVIGYILGKLYEFFYFHSNAFYRIKERIQKYIDDCNALNAHIENLKNAPIGNKKIDYGRSEYYDNSRWNYKRPALNYRYSAPNVYNCSLTVFSNAREQPFKYICKYFDLPQDENTLAYFENILNNFEAAEEGKRMLRQERQTIICSIGKELPLFIRYFSKNKLEEKFGFERIDFSTAYFPQYIFQYTSSGGNSSTRCVITMDIGNLNRFIDYLSHVIKFRRSVAGQRALMTSRFRRYILQRDNYTCRYCGVSLEEEPHLLLEVDHIFPLSKGGLTTEDNLQTLCWRCNRTKGQRT